MVALSTQRSSRASKKSPGFRVFFFAVRAVLTFLRLFIAGSPEIRKETVNVDPSAANRANDACRTEKATVGGGRGFHQGTREATGSPPGKAAGNEGTWQ